MLIELPWPDSRLSPNDRVHYHALARVKATARSDAFHATRAAIPLSVAQQIAHGDEPIPVKITFTPPDNRRRDRDNMQYLMKSALDGIAQALGVDDVRFHPTYAFNAPEKPGRVTVTFG